MKKKQYNTKKRKFLNIFILIFSFSILFISIIPIVNSIPPLPTEFYGNVTKHNAPLTSGNTITAYVNNAIVCGTFDTQRPGVFGTLTCRGKDTTDPDNGPVNGDIITFKIGTDPTSTLLPGNNTPVPITWSSGEFKYIILVTPPIVCGDGFCDRYESCGTCPLDCGQCPNGNQSNGNQSNGNGTQSGGGGASGGAVNTAGQTPPIEPQPPQTECKESWACADWGPCQLDNTEQRECVDVNNCPNPINKPETSRECIYSVPPISINITPRNNITIITPPEREKPQIIATCSERMPFFSIPSLLFILLVILVLLEANRRLQNKIKQIDKNTKLEEIKKLELKFHQRRQTYTFMVVFTILAIVVYLYHYFFFLCRDTYMKNLWLLALFVIVSPLIIHLVTEFMKFREKQNLNRSKILNDTHYLHVKKLLEIANQELIRSESAISNIIYSLNKSKQFETMLQQNIPIKKIYEDMIKLYDVYKKGAQAISLEKDLVQNIEQLAKDDGFRAIAQKYPELDSLRSSLILLYKAYASKQELYNEITKIEQEYEEASIKKPEPKVSKTDSLKAKPVNKVK